MMNSNCNQATFSAHLLGNNAKNAKLPQSPCGAPSDARKSNADSGVENIHDAMAMMTMTEGNGGVTADESAASVAKENVRPNSGRRKWRKKVDQKHRRVAAAGDEGPTASGAIEGDRDADPTKNSAEKKAKNGKKFNNFKSKRAVVVEISLEKMTPARPILPSMDFDAARVSAARGSSSPSGNDESPSGGRVKKTRPYKNKKYPSRHRPKAKRGEEANIHGTSDFSTNAGGASVLALLGQYPVPLAGGSYDESSCPSSQVMMSGANYYGQYDPTSPPCTGTSSGAAIPSTYGDYAYNGMPYPYTAPDMQYGATYMMTSGYYVPVMMNNQDGSAYYTHDAESTEYPAYYVGYAPNETMELSAHHPVDGSSKTLNIDAPAFEPKEKHGE